MFLRVSVHTNRYFHRLDWPLKRGIFTKKWYQFELKKTKKIYIESELHFLQFLLFCFKVECWGFPCELRKCLQIWTKYKKDVPSVSRFRFTHIVSKCNEKVKILLSHQGELSKLCKILSTFFVVYSKFLVLKRLKNITWYFWIGKKK